MNLIQATTILGTVLILVGGVIYLNPLDSSKAPPKQLIGCYSDMDDVHDLFGEPNGYKEKPYDEEVEWTYEGVTIEFDSEGKVIGWDIVNAWRSNSDDEIRENFYVPSCYE